MPTTVFVGLCTLDIAYAVPRYPGEDTKTRARDQFLGAGGPAANAAVACAALSGQATTLVTALGEHQLAQLIRHDLREFGVIPVDTTPDAQHRPPVSSIVVATETGTRTVVSLDGSQITAPFDPARTDLLDDASMLLLDGHYPDLARGFATAARARAIPVVLDAGRWRDSHADLLALTDIAICSSDFAPPRQTGDLFDHLHAHGVRYAAVTHGGDPITYSMPGERGTIDIPPATAVDTLGAGDILHGAFCHYHAVGQPFPRALRSAAAIATLSCAHLGTREWIHAAPAPEPPPAR